jgi:hypothetical protein
LVSTVGIFIGTEVNFGGIGVSTTHSIIIGTHRGIGIDGILGMVGIHLGIGTDHLVKDMVMVMCGIEMIEIMFL